MTTNSIDDFNTHEYDDDDDEYEEYADWRGHPLDAMLVRLHSAVLLSHHGIRTVVWGEDALLFAFSEPGFCPMELHILVEEHLLEPAAKVLEQNLPYRLNLEPFPNLFDIGPDGQRRTCFPPPIRLTHEKFKLPKEVIYTPLDILIHPASFYKFDIADADRSMALEGLPDEVRFPTQAAFIDSLIDTMRTPPEGYVPGCSLTWETRNLLATLLHTTLRERPRILEGGQLNAECRVAIDRVKVENREELEWWLRPYDTSGIIRLEESNEAKIGPDEPRKPINTLPQPENRPAIALPGTQPQPSHVDAFIAKKFEVK